MHVRFEDSSPMEDEKPNMTPVKKDHLANMSHSITANLTLINKNKYREECKVRKSFADVRQLLDAREKWLLDQIQHMSHSQISVLQSQNEQLQNEMAKCNSTDMNTLYMPPPYRFSEENLPKFRCDWSDVKDAVFEFGQIKTGPEASPLSSSPHIDSWLKRSMRSDSVGSGTASVADKLEKGEREEMDMWLHKQSLFGYNLDRTTQLFDDLEVEEKKDALEEKSDLKQWIASRDVCKTICPEIKYPASSEPIEIENLGKMNCMSSGLVAGQQNKWLVNRSGSAEGADLQKWLVKGSCGGVGGGSCGGSGSVSGLGSPERSFSECSTPMSSICEANEICQSIEHCISQPDQHDSCYERYQDWLLLKPSSPSQLKRGPQSTAGDDISDWLVDKPKRTYEPPQNTEKIRKSSFDTDRSTFMENYNIWLRSNPDMKWLAK